MLYYINRIYILDIAYDFGMLAGAETNFNHSHLTDFCF